MHTRVKEIYMIMLYPELKSSINVQQAVYQLGLIHMERKLKERLDKLNEQ